MRVRAAAHAARPTHPWPWRALGLPCGGPGAALGWRVVARVSLAGRGPGFVLGLRLASSSDANSYEALPINFPIPEFISDTNNI